MQVRRATTDDLRQLDITAMRAFASDPVMRWLYPDDASYFAPDGDVMRPGMLGWLALNEVWCTDDVAALAVWIPPVMPDAESSAGERHEDKEAESSAEPVPPDLLARFEIIGPLLAAHRPTEPHWYLQLLATHPDWQRRGMGAQLMASMFARADREGLPCWLETETLVNVAYYQRHGFEVRAEFDIPTGEHPHRFSSFGGDPATEVGPHMWGMYRAPR